MKRTASLSIAVAALTFGAALAHAAEDRVKEGTVTATDAPNKTFTMKLANGAIKFSVDNATVITKDGKPAGADAIQVGQAVTVTFGKAGEWRMATKVEIGAAAKTPAVATPPSAKAGDYQVTRSIKVGSEGKCEAMTLDASGKLLYVPRANKVAVVDVAEGKVVGEVQAKGTPRCVALVPAANRGFVACRGDNSIIVFDLKTYQVLGQIAVAGEPTMCVYDAASKKVLVCCSEGKCIVPMAQDIDLKTGKPDAAIELEGRPTSIVSDNQGTAYVTVTDTDTIVLIDTSSMSVLTKWTLSNSARPADISLDNKNSRVYVGLRLMRLAALSIVDGRELANIELQKNNVEDTAVFGDKVFVTTTEGNLMVVGQVGGKYEVQQVLKTGEGASAIAVDPKSGTVYVPTFERTVKDSFKIQVVEKK